IGAQPVWACFRRNKFAKELGPVAFFRATLVGAKEWRVGNRFRNLRNLRPISLRPCRPQVLLLLKLPPLRRSSLPLREQHLRREADCRGTSDIARDCLPPSLKRCRCY